jgi:ATP-dependent Lhr-like helicase
VGALTGCRPLARTHGPFLTVEPAKRWGCPQASSRRRDRLAAAGSLLLGSSPGGAEREWCDRGPPAAASAPLAGSAGRWNPSTRPPSPVPPEWHGIAPVGEVPPPFRGSAALERLAEVVDQLAGLPIPASVLERDVLPARIPGYQPRLLDELGALGEVAWVGRGSLGRDDGRIALIRPGREVLRPTGTPDGAERPAGPRHEAIRAHLAQRGASFYRGAVRRRGWRPTARS